MYCVRQITKNSGILNAVFSGICLHVHSYLALLRHIHTYWEFIKAYSDLFRHSAPYIKHLDKHNLAIFRAMAYLEPGAYSNPVKRWPGTFRTLPEGIIRSCLEHYETLAYPQIWHARNPGIFRTSIIASRRIFRTLSYLRKFTNIQNSDTFKTRQVFRTFSKI